MTDIEDRIRRGLSERADRDDPPRTPIEVVREAASRQRRGRRNLAVGVAAAAAAVVAAGWFVVPRDSWDQAVPDPPPADRATDRSGTDRAGSTDSAFERSLPRGPAPQVPYVVSDEYRTPDGTVLELAMPGQSGRSGASAVTPFEGGALVADTLFFEGTNGLFLLDGSGTTELGPCASGAGAASDDQQEVAWATFGCPESDRPAPLTVRVATAAGVVDTFEVPTDPDSSVLTSVVGQVGDAVVLNRGGGIVLADPDGTVRPVVDAGSAVDVAAGRAIVAGAAGADRVVDLADGATVWTAGPGLLSFSPDGDRVLGRVGNAGVAILDSRTGSAVQEFALPSAPSVTQVVWEDDDRLLLLIETPGGTSIVRVLLSDEPVLQRAGGSFPAGERVVLAE